MNKKLQQFWQRMKREEKTKNEKIKSASLPRTTSVRKFLHFLARSKDRGASKQ